MHFKTFSAPSANVPLISEATLKGAPSFKRLAQNATPVLDLVRAGYVVYVHADFDVDMGGQLHTDLTLVVWGQEHDSSPEPVVF